ncbi:MAG: hypothetical protein IKB51_02885 [Clostridia bacterium]|nr:hypothetical protein [Clostridia bacterium]
MKLNLFLYKLENKIRKIAIEKLMQMISVAMLIVFAVDTVLMFASDGQAISLNALLAFDRAAIFRGQVWRIVSFIFVYPASTNLLFTLLALYFYYWTGTAVEGYWGKARFNLYYLFGIIGTLIAGFIVGYIDNMYLNLSIFLAFSAMFPETKVLLFFFIPVKVKWIGIAEGALLLLLFILGSWADRAAILAAILNFLLFFGYDLINRIKRAYQDYKWRKNNYRY